MKELFDKYICTYSKDDDMTLNKVYDVYVEPYSIDTYSYTIYNDNNERQLFFPILPNNSNVVNRSINGSYFEKYNEWLQKSRDNKINKILN